MSETLLPRDMQLNTIWSGVEGMWIMETRPQVFLASLVAPERDKATGLSLWFERAIRIREELVYMDNEPEKGSRNAVQTGVPETTKRKPSQQCSRMNVALGDRNENEHNIARIMAIMEGYVNALLLQ